MKIENYKDATPIIEELSKLSKLILPDVQLNDNTKNIEVVNGRYEDSVNVKFCFYGNDYGNYNPIIINGNEMVLLHNHEYEHIKKVINTIIDNRINIQMKSLNEIK